MALTEIVALIVLGFPCCLSKQHTLREVGSKLHHVMRSPIYLLRYHPALIERLIQPCDTWGVEPGCGHAYRGDKIGIGRLEVVGMARLYYDVQIRVMAKLLQLGCEETVRTGFFATPWRTRCLQVSTSSLPPCTMLLKISTARVVSKPAASYNGGPAGVATR